MQSGHFYPLSQRSGPKIDLFGFDGGQVYRGHVLCTQILYITSVYVSINLIEIKQASLFGQIYLFCVPGKIYSPNLQFLGNCPNTLPHLLSRRADVCLHYKMYTCSGILNDRPGDLKTYLCKLRQSLKVPAYLCTSTDIQKGWTRTVGTCLSWVSFPTHILTVQFWLQSARFHFSQKTKNNSVFTPWSIISKIA